MNIIVKPGGLALIGLAIGGLAVLAVVQVRKSTSDQPKAGDINHLADSPWSKPTLNGKVNGNTRTSPIPAPTASPLSGQPYTVETPAATIQNPNFESTFALVRPYNSTGTIHGLVANHWYDDSSWAPVNIDYVQDSNNPHGGTYSQRITVNSIQSGAIQLVQPLRLHSGRTYSGSLYVRADHTMKVHLLLRQAEQPGSVYGSTEATVDADWKKVTVTGRIGSKAITYLMLQMNESGSVWVDDASLQSK